jgi:hypothetical protein
LSVLLAVAGISQALATPGEPNAEETTLSWYAITQCGLDEYRLGVQDDPASVFGAQLSNDLTSIARHDVCLPTIALPPGFSEQGAYVEVTDWDSRQDGNQRGASTETLDWTKPFDQYLASARANESHRLKFGYRSTTTTEPLFGMRLSF